MMTVRCTFSDARVRSDVGILDPMITRVYRLLFYFEVFRFIEEASEVPRRP